MTNPPASPASRTRPSAVVRSGPPIGMRNGVKCPRCDAPSIRPRARRSATNRCCRSYGVEVDLLLEVRQQVADADVDVLALGKDVGVAVRAAVAVEHRHRVGLGGAQRGDGRLLHHVEREPRGGPARVHPEAPRDHAVHAVGRDHHPRPQLASVTRAQRDAVGILARLRDRARRQQLRARLDAPATPAGSRTRGGGSSARPGRGSRCGTPGRTVLRDTGWIPGASGSVGAAPAATGTARARAC